MITTLVQGLLDNINYLSLTILMAIESSAIPFPSEIVVPPAGYMAAEGELSFPLVIVFATIGSMIGALANYVIAYFVGRPVVYKFVDSKLGHLCLLNSEKMHRAENYFNKRGAVATLVGRLIPVIRQLISIPAGLAKMNMAKFLLYTCLGAGAWNVVLAVIGYSLQSVVDREHLYSMVKEYEAPIVYAICGVVGVALVYYIVRNRIKKVRQQKCVSPADDYQNS